MKFRLIWPGSHADDEMRAAIDRYLNRIRHFFPIEVIEVAPVKGGQKENDAAIMHAQSARLIAAIPGQGVRVAVDERGDMIDSLKFAKWVEQVSVSNPHGMNFVMGGDLGLTDDVRGLADRILSLSRMTLPHQLARVVLVEQLYRACTLIRHISYHR